MLLRVVEHVSIWIVINLISSVNSWSTVIITGNDLSKLIRYLTIPECDLSLFIRLHPTAVTYVKVISPAAWLNCSPVREQRFVYLKEGLLVIDE